MNSINRHPVFCFMAPFKPPDNDQLPVVVMRQSLFLPTLNIQILFYYFKARELVLWLQMDCSFKFVIKVCNFNKTTLAGHTDLQNTSDCLVRGQDTLRECQLKQLNKTAFIAKRSLIVLSTIITTWYPSDKDYYLWLAHIHLYAIHWLFISK